MLEGPASGALLPRRAVVHNGRVRSGIALLCVAGALLCGCGSSGSSNGGAKLGGYPASSEKSFLDSCVREATLHASKDNATKYCNAALACIEKQLSYKEFQVLQRNLVEGRSNPKAKAVLSCVKSARQQVLGS